MARILVAEDDAAVREFVSRALSHDGHEVCAVNDGLEALEKIDQDEYDLLITDIVMPGLDGIGLALKVTKDHPDVLILMMTGFAAERQRAHNLDALIHQVISKPFTLRQICDAASEALSGGE
ncbi:MAG: response regulator [Alphaproteobacteria bacterium]